MTKENFYVVLAGLQIFLALVASELSDECKKQLTCGDCIRLNPECAWCEDLDYFGQRTPKCDELKKHIQNNCKKISNPLSNNDGKSNDESLNDNVKVSPQNLTLRLRPGQPTSFKVKVRMPDNFPIDLYYLMDLSGSMLEDIQQVKILGKKLAAQMSDITKQFRLGFGAFVDKPLAPYINTYPAFLKHPDMFNPKSVPAFGFINMLPLSKDPTDFEDTVAALNISGNVDNPEGGLDALVQVAVCEQQVGWQNKVDARRLVILTTDSGYHFAGDGLLGGVVTPYDNRCHLSPSGHYTHSKYLDYPSVGRVRDILLQNQVAPIFAITKTQVKVYENLASFLGNETGAVARRLNSDSSNIVPLVREAYLRIAQTQTVTDNAPDGIKIKYTANCPDGKREGENTCTGVKIGQEVSFDVSVTAADCTKKQPGFSLKTAFGDVNVKLEYICDCECESLENTELKSPTCNSNGSLSCGICDCNDKTGGRLCGCPKKLVNDPTLCQSGNSSLVCSGRGKCVCGECVCSESKNPSEVIYGKQCECTNLDCPRDPVSNIVCGGPEHGVCDCGSCQCVGNWTGPDCMCTKDTSTCIDENGVLCSGRGTCECGKCACNETSGYSGEFCGECKACSCEANRDCVQCWVFGGGKLSPGQCKQQCSDIEYVAVDDIERDMGAACQFKDEDDCVFYFAYKQNKERSLVISYKRKTECPEEVGALIVILAVILGVLGVGLALLLIWKLLATIQDRREFAKFEKERQNAKWDTGENPIFKQATTTFQNPTYGGK